MKQRVGLLGSIVLGIAFSIAGVSGDFVMPQSVSADQNGQGGNGSYSVPEPSPLILLGLGMTGLGIFALWRRMKNTN